MATLTLRPSGNGTFQEWDGPLFSSHYQQVDESSQDGDTTFIYDNGITLPDGSPATDSFATQNPLLSAGVIDKIEVSFYGKLTAGTGKIAPMIYLSGNREDGSAETLTSSYALYTQEFSRPGGGNWLWSDLVPLEIGVIASEGSGCKLGNCIRCTQIYVTVTYFDRFSEMDAKGYVDSPFMEPRLYITETNSDLSGGDDVDLQLVRVTDVEDWTAFSIAASSTETQYWYSNANDPYNDDWETGDMLLVMETKNNESSSYLHFRFRVSRINSSGTVQESSSWSSWYDSPWGDRELCILTLSSVSWTGGSRTDRIRIDLECKNDHTSGKTMGFYANDADSFLNTYIHLWRVSSITAKGHIIQGRSTTITAKGHIIEERFDAIIAKGHVLQERLVTITGSGHILQGRSSDITNKGHILQNRLSNILGKGHILQNRWDTMLGKGHILQHRSNAILGKGYVGTLSPSPSPSPFPSPQERETGILAKGHVLQHRSDTTLGKGHVTQYRSDAIIAKGHILQHRFDRIYARATISGKKKKPFYLLEVIMRAYLLKKREEMEERNERIRDSAF